MRFATGIARLLEEGFPEDLAADVAAGIIPEDEAVQILARDLSRDPASRLERARSMDFDPVEKRVYHGTDVNIKAFEPSVGGLQGPGVYTSPFPGMAGEYAIAGGGRLNPARGQRDTKAPPFMTPEGKMMRSGAAVYPLTYRGELMPYKQFLS